VFFSLHYDRDVRCVVQVRNSWVVRARGEAQPFYEYWEERSPVAGRVATSITILAAGVAMAFKPIESAQTR
jgi:hypothetical protein